MCGRKTLPIARELDCHVAQNAFQNHASQRNHALQHLPICSEWVLFLDADEWLPDALKREISELIASSPPENGFYQVAPDPGGPVDSTRLLPLVDPAALQVWQSALRASGGERALDRGGHDRPIAQRFHPRGQEKRDRLDRQAQPLCHDRVAGAFNARKAPDYREIDARLFGTQAQRKRWLRHKLWSRLPPLIRPLFYFFYRYILAGGFLDGREAFAYHFLQGLWFPMLIDIKYLELKRAGAWPLSERHE